ncbi:hypothetical protein Nwi_1563 [Nitrobacter winogradskyi Nb-255]|uniref:Uncharacterized protein n=1 Tax=Nitrobacter winogradskyi (strain ATCC 25391 / DSM 10237 / CIP 104748 / NCIMB 11846 / Nb-255) TaxID=323098 RepID=Q3SSB7_NITWN|nr:hypothetical protein [Nitrobacter winogradskyi]ABA04824.1 hypothetical protein Nwi_1563 [Nitrobacter winogradskyi Nb-255]
MKRRKTGRLAMRCEGKFWNAYYALPDTMEDAILLGSIHIRLVADVTRKNLFMALMQEAVSDMLTDITGTRPTWPDEPHAAPPHERAGHS